MSRTFVSRAGQNFKGPLNMDNPTVGGYLKRSKGTLAALGSNQATAAIITKEVTQVTASDGAKGVKLPTPVGGEEIVVVNTVSGQALLVYPDTGGTIDYAAANAAYSLAGRKHARFYAFSPTQWYAILGA